MDGGAWKAAVHRVAKSQTGLSDFTLTFHFHALEKEMATHSSVLAWRIPGTGEPGGLPSVGSQRVGHDWSDLAAIFSSKVHLFPLLCGQFSELWQFMSWVQSDHQVVNVSTWYFDIYETAHRMWLRILSISRRKNWRSLTMLNAYISII